MREGRVSQEALDAKVARLLATLDRAGALDDPPDGDESPVDRPEDRELLRQVATHAIVLLANNGALPLSADGLRRVALIGPGAERLAIMGGGSARVVPHYELSLAEALGQRLGEHVELVVEAGCSLATGGGGIFAGRSALDAQGRQADGPDDATLLARAVAAAKGADVAVVVVGTNELIESESYDRADMDLPGAQADLVKAVMAANPNTVVALNSGSPLNVAFAQDAAALLQIWFGGQELAHALVDVLMGDAEPGGRLPITLPVCLEHTPAFGNFPAESSAVHYGEGLLMGYRWYEARHLPVLFPFGHGLSYTQVNVARTGQQRALGSRGVPER